MFDPDAPVKPAAGLVVSNSIAGHVQSGGPAPRRIYKLSDKIRDGNYDLDPIGAFTYLGAEDMLMQHITWLAGPPPPQK